MPTRTTLTLAAVLVPAIRTALDTHDAVVELVGRSGIDRHGLWLGNLVIEPDIDSHRFGLGGHLSLSGDADGLGDEGARLVLFLGPLALSATYVGAELVDPVAPYSGGRAA